MSLGFDEAQEVQCLFEVKVPSCDNGKVLVCAINEHFPDAGDTLWIRRFQLQLRLLWSSPDSNKYSNFSIWASAAMWLVVILFLRTFLFAVYWCLFNCCAQSRFVSFSPSLWATISRVPPLLSSHTYAYICTVNTRVCMLGSVETVTQLVCQTSGHSYRHVFHIRGLYIIETRRPKNKGKTWYWAMLVGQLKANWGNIKNYKISASSCIAGLVANSLICIMCLSKHKAL